MIFKTVNHTVSTQCPFAVYKITVATHSKDNCLLVYFPFLVERNCWPHSLVLLPYLCIKLQCE